MTLSDLPIKTLLTSQRNQIYSEASSTHFSAINLSYYTLYPLNSSWIYIKYPTFQITIRVIVEHNSIWHSVIYQQNTSHLPTQSNIFWSIFNIFSAINLSYTYALPIILLIDPNKSQTFQYTIRVIVEHNSIWHFRIPIKTLFAYQRNQIYSEASSTHFSAINLSYYTLYPLNSSWIYIKYPTFQITIRLIAEHSLIWHFRLPIKTLLASQRNQIYSEASSTHFSAINLSYFTLYSSKCSLFQIHHYISENNQSYRGTQFNLTLCDLPIKTLLTSQRNQIYSEASSTHFSAINLSYTYAYPSYSYWYK